MNRNRLVVFYLGALVAGSGLQGMDASSEQELGEQLVKAARNGNFERVKSLIKQGASVDVKDSSGSTALMFAATYGNKAICDLLLANKASVNAKDNDGNTPLIAAAAYGNKDVCDLLLANNALVNVKNDRGQTPLMVAAQYGEGICKLLIDAILKPTKEQKDKLIIFLAQKKRGGLKEGPMPPDMIREVGKQMLAQIRKQNKPNAVMQIDEIDDEAIKRKLLAYVEEKTK